MALKPNVLNIASSQVNPEEAVRQRVGVAILSYHRLNGGMLQGSDWPFMHGHPFLVSSSSLVMSPWVSLLLGFEELWRTHTVPGK
jgi:hypothetical protein